MICVHCGEHIQYGMLKCNICGMDTEFSERFDYQPPDVPPVRRIQKPELIPEPEEEKASALEEPMPEEEADEEMLNEEDPAKAEESCETAAAEAFFTPPKRNTKKALSKKIRSFLDRLLPVFVILFLLQGLTAEAFAENSVQKARNSVVRVASVLYWDGEPIVDLIATGTGICVGDGGNGPAYVLTNRHVVDPENEELLSMLSLYSPIGYSSLYQTSVTEKIFILTEKSVFSVDYNGNVTLSDKEDLALIRLGTSLKERSAATFGNSGGLSVTDVVYAIGFPGIADVDDTYSSYASSFEMFLAAALPSGVDDMTVTQGTVSRKDVMVNGVSHVQHEADISHGNSGGPLVDKQGRVVGINTWLSIDTDAASKKQYSIDVDTVKAFLKRNNVSYKEAGSFSFSERWLFLLIPVGILIVAVIVKSTRKPDPIPAEVVITDRSDVVKTKDPLDTGTSNEESSAEHGAGPVVFVHTSFGGGPSDSTSKSGASSTEKAHAAGFVSSSGFDTSSETESKESLPVTPVIRSTIGAADKKTEEKSKSQKEKLSEAGFTELTGFDV